VTLRAVGGAAGVDDSRVGTPQGVQPHPELGAVGAQGLDLSAAGDVGDRQGGVPRGGGVGQSDCKEVSATDAVESQFFRHCLLL